MFLLVLAGLCAALPATAVAQTGPDTLGPVSGRPVTVDGIQPADVLARVELLRGELELIRFEMGKPKDWRHEPAVTNVAPREVIFQAETLYRKANLLHLELTGRRQPSLAIALPREIRSYHVWVIVNGAYKPLLDLKKRMGITESLDEKPQDPSVTPTEVFRAIVQANRQFEQLIEHGPTTRDVFHRVTLATYYVSSLLERFPETTRMPAAQAFERGKRPVDVYRRLLKCYAQIRAITELSGFETLKLEMPQAEAAEVPAQLRPSDIYDMATLIISELAFLQTQLKDSYPPVASVDPGFKLPAHVYQRAGILLRQLTELKAQVKTKPNWLADYTFL